MNSDIACPPAVFFCGCSWGAAFHIGVYKGLVERWGYQKLKNSRIGGNSSGALVGLGVALGRPVEEAEAIYRQLAVSAEECGVFGKMTGYHKRALSQLLVSPLDYQRLNGRFFVGVTYFAKRYELVSHWDSNEDLMNTLHASFHIPFYCSYTRALKDGVAIDGGFGSVFSHIEGPTLVVTPVSKAYGDIICVPTLNLKDSVFPLPEEKYEVIRDKGLDALHKWDGKYSEDEPRSYSVGIVLLAWLLRYAEEVRWPHVTVVGLMLVVWYFLA